jgi:hypothetical protein
LKDFLLKPASPRRLALIRIGLGAMLLAQAILSYDLFATFVGPSRFVFDMYGSGFHIFGIPSPTWIDALAAYSGISFVLLMHLVLLLYVVSIVLVLVGWRTRLCSFVAWFTHSIIYGSALMGWYKTDEIAHMLLVHFLWMPVGEAFSLDSRAAGEPQPSALARLSLRALQFQVCLIYLAAGWAKLVSPGWANGDIFWDILTNHLYTVWTFEWLAYVPWLTFFLAWGTIVAELSYPVLIWFRRTRVWIIAVIVGLHTAIAVVMGAITLSFIMIWLTLCLFGPEIGGEEMLQTADQFDHREHERSGVSRSGGSRASKRRLQLC